MQPLFLIILISLGIGTGHSEEFEKDIVISEGINRSSFITIELREIGSAVVFHWPDHPAVCPVTTFGDFLLEKLNPRNLRYLIEDHRCQAIAGGKDSTTYNFDFIYEVVNFRGAKFYLKVISGDKAKLRIRVSDNLASVSTLPAMGKAIPGRASEMFLINGRIGGNGTRLRPGDAFLRRFVAARRPSEGDR